MILAMQRSYPNILYLRDRAFLVTKDCFRMHHHEPQLADKEPCRFLSP